MMFAPKLSGDKLVSVTASLSGYTPATTALEIFNHSDRLILPVPATIPSSKAIAKDSNNISLTNLSSH